MRKNLLIKSVAIVLCLAFIGIAGSGLFAAERSTSRIDVRLLFQKPIQFLISVFPGFNSIFSSKKRQVVTTSTPTSSGIVKPTGDLLIGRPSTGD
jgi:hypothetical protein